MNSRVDNGQIFNLALLKFLGLYQLLDPKTEKFLGRHNVYWYTLVFIICSLCLFTAILGLNGVYYWTDNKRESLFYFVVALNTVFVSYKMCLVLYHSKHLWDCLLITRFDFTTNGHRNGPLLDSWRKLSIRSTYVHASLLMLPTIIYLVFPLVLGDMTKEMKNRDGSSGNYRLNVLNLYLFVSDETYTAHFSVFYVAETVTFFVMALSIVGFDMILITMGLATTCQLKIICTAFELVGHESLHSPNNSINNKICNAFNLDVLSDLKTIIIDHQRVLKKYDTFLTITRWTTLFEMSVCSSSIIILCFTFLSDFIQGISAEVLLMNSVLAVPVFVLLYVKCNLFGNLHNQKDDLIFALYCSNWTQMNMECKKLILLTMKMNNSHQQKLQFTRTKVINMEMFISTIRFCYSFTSVLVNCIKQK